MLFTATPLHNRTPRLSPARAMTLTEVLVSSVIVSVILAGIVSVEFAVRRINADFSRDTQLYMNLAVMAEHIRYAAASAVGDVSSPGFVFHNVAADTNDNYFCFRQDWTQGTTTVNHTPEIYTDDVWRCYSRLGGAGANRTAFYTCDHDADPSDPNVGPAACSASDHLLGSIVHDVFTCAGACYPPTLMQDPATGRYFFQFQLINRRTPSAGADVSGGKLTRSGTAENAQSSIEYRVFPESHSF